MGEDARALKRASLLSECFTWNKEKTETSPVDKPEVERCIEKDLSNVRVKGEGKWESSYRMRRGKVYV